MQCPLCGSGNLSFIGIPAYHTLQTVAGREPGVGSKESFRLIRCNVCGLVAKYPIIAPELLHNCYRDSSPYHWLSPGNAESRRFAEIEQLAKLVTPGYRVLDVGCSNGLMLSAWGDQWDKYGVEPSIKARDIATGKGIIILGDEIESIGNDCCFDIISLIDVIEHIPNPGAIISRLFSLLSSSGSLIILTGTTDYWWWKVVDGGYWYASFPEHIYFYSEKTFQFIARKYGGQIIHSQRLSHSEPVSPLQYALQLSKNFAYYTLSNLVGERFFLRNQLFQRGYPSLTQAKDHLLIAIQKDGRGYRGRDLFP